MRCSRRVRNTALDFNRTFIEYKKADPGTGPEQYVFNFSKVVSNSTADAVGECYTTFYNVYVFNKMRAALFPTTVSFTTSFL